MDSFIFPFMTLLLVNVFSINGSEEWDMWWCLFKNKNLWWCPIQLYSFFILEKKINPRNPNTKALHLSLYSHLIIWTWRRHGSCQEEKPSAIRQLFWTQSSQSALAKVARDLHFLNCSACLPPFEVWRVGLFPSRRFLQPAIFEHPRSYDGRIFIGAVPSTMRSIKWMA